MIIKKALLAFSIFFICTQAFGMEAPPLKAKAQVLPPNMATFVGLPDDVKGCLLQHLATADITETEREILVLAATNKQLINNPQVMIAILNAVAQKVAYTAHAIELAERLQKKEKTLPVMKNETVGKWIAGAKAQLKIVPGFRLAMAGYGLQTKDINNATYIRLRFERILRYLDDKNLDINCQSILKRTFLMECLREDYGLYAIKLCISLGVNIDIPDYSGKTCLQVATENRRNDVVTLLQQVQEIRKQKLALKQMVKQ